MAENVTTRKRKLTKREKEYEIILKKKGECYAVNRQLRSFMRNLSITQDTDPYDESVKRLQEIKELATVFESNFEAWKTIIDEERELLFAQQFFDERYEEISRFIDRTEESLATRRCTLDEDNESGSTDTASWLRERDEAAEIKAQLTILSRKQRLRNEMEKLELEERLAIVQEKGKVYEENEEFPNTPRRPEYTPREPLAPSPLLPVKPEPTEALFFDDANDLNTKHEEPLLMFLDKQTKLTEILAKQQQQGLLPRLQLSSFTNDPLDYDQFIRNFEHQIESTVDSNQVRLQHLQQCLQGESKELIKGCLYKDANTGYPEAKHLLQKTYGDPYKVSTSYIKRVNDWPTVKPGDDSALHRLSVFLTQCVSAMESLECLALLDHPHNLQALVRKLPFKLQEGWRRHAISLRQSRKSLPQFKDLSNFILREAEVATDPIFSSAALKSHYSNVQNQPRPTTTMHKATTRATSIQETYSPDKSVQSCKLCQANHDLDDCDKFKEKPLVQRRDYLKENGLCFACYQQGHRSRGCTRKRMCKLCGKCHPTSLHDDNYVHAPRQPEIMNARTVSTNADVLPSTNSHAAIQFLPIIPVKLQTNTEVIYTYAMLDNCSTGTFISDYAVERLKIDGVKTTIAIKTLNGTCLQPSKRITRLTVSDLNGMNVIPLPQTFSRDEIPATEGEIPRADLVRHWSHLVPIADKMPRHLDRLQVDLLIGMNCPAALQPMDFVTGKRGDPYGMLTFTGWTVVGPMSKLPCEVNENSPRTFATSVCESRCDISFAVQAQVKEVITPETLRGFIDSEFSEPPCAKDQKISLEDTQFIRKLDNGVELVDGHYQLPLPFREDKVIMPDNKEHVKRKMSWLKRKLLQNEKLYVDYKTFMNDIISKDYARKVPDHLISAKPGSKWYIPHHGVYHPRKPEKIRVVFNCSAKYQGISLNDKLLQGPDLTNSLIGVLIRFRARPVAFMGDIDAMFHQVRVNEEDRSFLRFLWWSDADLSTEPEEYQMNVHLFGAVSSPSCANYAVKRIAKDFTNEISKETAETLTKNFYVDDCLRSEDDEKTTIKRLRDVREACSKGGFTLSKIVSNKRAVIDTIPRENRSKSLKNVNLSDHLPQEHALGVRWNVEDDQLGFLIKPKDLPLTRRGILSSISSIYDPLGMAAPVILKGKRILQELCRNNADWDHDIPDEYKTRWMEWKSSLPDLERFKMDRTLKPENFGAIANSQIHNFSDASLTGFGQVSYLRLTNEKGQIKCSFLMGKARLAPLKDVTIPRLELNAAVLSVRIGTRLKEELEEKVDECFYWTDSSTVLKYLHNRKNRYKTFVANRIQMITDNTLPTQWRYVRSSENPADDASRGLCAANLTSQHRWIRGPEFLWRLQEEWPEYPVDVKIKRDDPEVKTLACSFVTNTSLAVNADFLQRWSYFSSWYRLKRAVSLILKLQDKYRNNSSSNKTNVTPSTSEDLHRAAICILKVFQADEFPKEIEVLQNLKRCNINRATLKSDKLVIRKSSTLFRLDPFVDNDGLIRVGGRLRRSEELSEDQKYPIVIPKKGHITTLLIQDAHKRTAHSGRGITLNELRNNYWVINGNSAVRWFILKCVVCRRLRSSPTTQKMADLPSDRACTAPPFTHCAVDYFGPFTVKEGRKVLKRYGVLFTCLASRAIHLESAISLETDSFINTLRRFIARRGPVKSMRSDQGTNLVGATNELQDNLKKMDQIKVKEYLLRHGNADWLPQWSFNPPSASHMGGSWERLIRTTRAILVALMKEQGHLLNDESFRTLLTEAESIVNSRPLTFPTDDPQDLIGPLTPNHLLTMKAKVVLPPPGEFQKEDMYCRKQWRRVQYLAEIFWARWKREYLQTLQVRTKWNQPHRNIMVGDVVLVKDERTLRNTWPLARVLEVFPDTKGLVRSARVRTQTSVLDRPIHKLIVLLEH